MRPMRGGETTPRIPRTPRNVLADLRKRSAKDRFYPSQAKQLPLAPLAALRGMRGVEKTANPLSLAPHQGPNGLVRAVAARDARDARGCLTAKRFEVKRIEMPPL